MGFGARSREENRKTIHMYAEGLKHVLDSLVSWTLVSVSIFLFYHVTHKFSIRNTDDILLCFGLLIQSKLRASAARGTRAGE